LRIFAVRSVTLQPHYYVRPAPVRSRSCAANLAASGFTGRRIFASRAALGAAAVFLLGSAALLGSTTRLEHSARLSQGGERLLRPGVAFARAFSLRRRFPSAGVLSLDLRL